MLRSFLLSLAALLLVFVSPAFAKEPFFGSVTKIIDGDSMVIVTGSKKIEVRLYGVDCPEYDQPFSGDAKAVVRERVYGKKVLVQPLYYDTYQRLVAIVQYGDKTLNGELVLAGVAWVYPDYCHKKICNSWKQMEHMARKSRRGMWRIDRPVPPWVWKRMKRGY